MIIYPCILRHIDNKVMLCYVMLSYQTNLFTNVKSRTTSHVFNVEVGPAKEVKALYSCYSTSIL